MTDMDADLIRLRNWQAAIEARLAALEARPAISQSTITANVGVSPELQQEFDSLRSTISGLTAQLMTVEAKANDTSTVLVGVETALGSHSHPPSPSAESPPAPTAAPAGG